MAKTLHDLELRSLFKFDYDLSTVYQLIAIAPDGTGNGATVVRVASKPNGTYYAPVLANQQENANPYCGVIEVLMTFPPL